MTVFNTQADEDAICRVLKAYMEEWGHQNVVTVFPESWMPHANGSGYLDSLNKRVRMFFANIEYVAVCVVQNGDIVLDYRMPLIPKTNQ